MLGQPRCLHTCVPTHVGNRDLHRGKGRDNDEGATLNLLTDHRRLAMIKGVTRPDNKIYCFLWSTVWVLSDHLRFTLGQVQNNRPGSAVIPRQVR